MPRNFGSNSNLCDKSRDLRRNMTPEEKHLWYDFLKTYPVQFNRQRVIGNYIVDFYCRKANLVIEIDGKQHYIPDGLSYDSERTDYLNSVGIEVVRFLNKDINGNFENVCAHIDLVVKRRLGVIPHPPASRPPSPLGRLF
ncbi:MAG: endonuclease domain-containing protein [Oscillospiraceae bacterium]|nr:endonuclease domain-containing protein [Oscillospiraceae bacterium]MBQ8595263.1 endonuclease domain-containing protein [Oscillospiraceae bacterium]